MNGIHSRGDWRAMSAVIVYTTYAPGPTNSADLTQRATPLHRVPNIWHPGNPEVSTEGQKCVTIL